MPSKPIPAAECWCQAKVVRVSWDEIRAGLTRACEQDHCQRADRRARSAQVAA